MENELKELREEIRMMRAEISVLKVMLKFGFKALADGRNSSVIEEVMAEAIHHAESEI